LIVQPASYLEGIALDVVNHSPAAYKMWPVSPVKWVLRRFDHSAIYLSIAGYIARFR
jgi:hemolysin III